MSKRAERTRQRPFDSPGSLRAFDVFSPIGENTSNGGVFYRSRESAW